MYVNFFKLLKGNKICDNLFVKLHELDPSGMKKNGLYLIILN